VSIHAKCLAVETIDGRTVICGKSADHDRPDASVGRREHYDPSADMRWAAKSARRRAAKETS
jgi:hypothetical protein